MPHQCIECGRTFPDGSKEMLSGCPDCGGNKFQFKPAGVTDSSEPDPTTSESPTGSKSPTDPDPTAGFDSSPEADPERPPSDPEEPSSGPARSPDTTPSPDPPASSDPSGSPAPTDGPDPAGPRPERAAGTADPDTTDPVEGDAERIDDEEPEDTAQASARSDVVSPDELDRATRETGSPATESGSVEPPASQPGVDELRDELNEQFESIKIVSPGQYELNLMELYDRQEYIISLQEDGRYVIEMPDAWGVTDE
jgi:predicted  nucleic acid-binding Zn-ribbon protein